ncbi:MAG: proline--tRNA ligase [Mollicutes bacterium PWAP]|nr:proline--tRNA ligase [Mollicutes bacterium PWAP]
MAKEIDKITPYEKDFSKWYVDVIKQGNLIEYGPTKGSIIFKPNSFGIWEMIKQEFNKQFKKLNIENVYLPLLIPISYIEKEKKHIEGFAPELATVTHVGDKSLVENLVIRPTSETLFGELFQKIIRSHNDLPIIYNQWANVIRWEKTVTPFLRNSEFLWQEGHTAHSSLEEALEFSKKMINVYANFLRDYLAIEPLVGVKTENEKFAGADRTYTIEALMKDGRALQCGTSHFLGTNFSKSFNISFRNKQNKNELVFQTSWGVSTRLIGGLIMSHGDNRGIIIPPKIAPYQVSILELFSKKDERVKLISLKLKKDLEKLYIRTKIDSSNKTAGFKAANSEITGIPLRIEVGPRDLKNNEVTIVRRDNLEKININIKDVPSKVKLFLNDIQNNLYEKSKKKLSKNTLIGKTYEDMIVAIKNKNLIIMPFDGTAEDEENIKKSTGITTRCIIENKKDEANCFITEKKTTRWVVFGKAY